MGVAELFFISYEHIYLVIKWFFIRFLLVSLLNREECGLCFLNFVFRCKLLILQEGKTPVYIGF